MDQSRRVQTEHERGGQSMGHGDDARTDFNGDPRSEAA